MKDKKSQLGYTLIESIAFLSVMAMLSVAIFSTISKMLDKYKLSRIGNQIVDLQKSIDQRFIASESFAQLTAKLLIAERLVPTDMIANGKLYHAFAGPVTITASRGNRAYDIDFTQLGRAQCVELAMIDWRSRYTTHLISVSINEDVFEWKGPSAKKLPITLLHADASCKDGGRVNTITWQFQ